MNIPLDEQDLAVIDKALRSYIGESVYCDHDEDLAAFRILNYLRGLQGQDMLPRAQFEALSDPLMLEGQ